MQWMGLNELREKFLQFFESKQHLRLPSFPLVPQEDKSLLLINSGMAPMKKWFLGTEEPPNHRVCTCQKCIRTPDIESVGITDRHGTFFEMLGNFSFQDYFKIKAIPWAWEFFTSEEWLCIPKDKLHISVYENDDDAYDIWTKEVGIAQDHMVRLGKADNFWEHGSGPCGPCSEIYFDRGEEHGCGKPGCAPGCECDRFIEVWNLVFTEFDSDGQGNYEKLSAPNIDTGMGLERLACVMQDAPNLFEVDTMQKILQHVQRLSGKTYHANKKDDISMRVVTDHIRSTTFMVSDGILPSNEGRGYVLRRLLRRAARHGRMLGIKGAFLADVCSTVIEQNESAYPELRDHADYIRKTISAEEERFGNTIDAGLSRLNELIYGLKNSGVAKLLSGEEVFKLHDTFGFPLDLTREIAAEAGLSIDEVTFFKKLKEQREKARADRASRDIAGWEADLFSAVNADATSFVGYDELACEATVLALSDGEELQNAISTDDGEKQGVLVLLNKTPFYAESGGQVADTGNLASGSATLYVQHVKQAAGGLYVHTCVLIRGSVKVRDVLTAQVDEQRRRAIMRNHTSAHLLQAALRAVLGQHVHQAGSYVDNERMRFDFTHFSAMTQDEINQTERLVNEKIFEALPVTAKSMSIEEAKKLGAMALFGEKYGDVVRVIDVQDFSREFCGGTHVTNTSHLGSLRILSESSVAAGVRRIESTTGWGVLHLLDEREELLKSMAGVLKATTYAELPTRLEQLGSDAKRLQKELSSLHEKAANQKAGDVFKNPIHIEEIKLFAAYLKNTNPDALRKMCDMIKDNEELGVGVLIGESEGRVSMAVCSGSAAIARGVKAGELAKKASALAGGSGGGKPDFAMAGIKQPDKADYVLGKLPEILQDLLNT